MKKWERPGYCLLTTDDLPRHIGKTVDITVPAGSGITGYRAYYDEATYPDATLLEYDDEQIKVRFQTGSGRILFSAPIRIESKVA